MKKEYPHINVTMKTYRDILNGSCRSLRLEANEHYLDLFNWDRLKSLQAITFYNSANKFSGEVDVRFYNLSFDKINKQIIIHFGEILERRNTFSSGNK